MKQEGRAWEKGFFTLWNCILTGLESKIPSSSPLINGGFFPVHERSLLHAWDPWRWGEGNSLTVAWAGQSQAVWSSPSDRHAELFCQLTVWV